MSEIRRSLITGEPVLFAPERAKRFPDTGCPFCPGHEHETPPELARIGEPWRVRVFGNKYPFAPQHEVIVESRVHDATYGTIGTEGTYEVTRMYVERYRAMRAGHVTVFKNHGVMAGASIEHMHSQVVGTSFVPPRVRRELAGFALGCPLCEVEGHVIDESEHFVRIAPHGSGFAYEQWIVPRRHAANFSRMTDDETNDLALRLRDAAISMERIAASYNWLFMNFSEAGHWYVQAMPRLTTIAGFELASGTFIDIIDPAEAARKLRV